MNPVDFIGLAIKLGSSQQEAELRTAMSRAYYGAFHSARELLEECGIRFPPKELFGADVHRKVRFCLANSDTHDAAIIANSLNSLRWQRNTADYDLKAPSSAKLARASTQMAIEIFDALQRCRNEPAVGKFREKVRAYARDVLRLPIHDQ